MNIKDHKLVLALSAMWAALGILLVVLSRCSN